MDDFFAEQDRRMNIPDEDVDVFVRARLQHKNWPMQGHAGGPEGLFGPRSSEPQALHPLAPHFAGDACSPPQSGAVVSHSPIDSVKQRKEPCAETGDAGNNTNSACLSTTFAAADRAKHHRVLEQYSITKPADCSLRKFVSESTAPNPNTSRITARGSGVPVEFCSESTSPHPVGMCWTRPGISGQINVPSSTGPAQPSRIVQIADPTTPVIEQISEISAHTNARMNAALQPKKRKLDAPLISTPGNYSVIEAVSPPQILSRHLAPVPSSTTSDGHGNISCGTVEKFPDLSPADETSLTADVHPDIIANRLSHDSHAAGCIEGNPVPRMPAGFNTPAHPDVSNITSPGDTQPRQPCYAGREPHVSPIEAQPSSSMLAPKKGKARKTVNSNRASRRVSDNSRSSKQLKDKPKLVTPLEYAQKLQSRFGPQVKLKTNYLKEKHIFYIGGDMMYAGTTTRGRMEYIVKHGGTLVPKYDPEIVTHIVTDAGIRHTLKALSLKSLSDIPDHIPTVTWDWVISGCKRARRRMSKVSVEGGDSGSEDDVLDFEFMHAAFAERIDAGRKWKNVRRTKPGDIHGLSTDGANNHSGDISNISNFSQERAPVQTKGVPLTVLPPPPLDFQRIDGRKADGRAPLGEEENLSAKEDPLSEYYAEARAEREAQWNSDASDSDNEDDNFDHHQVPPLKKGFACDHKGKQPAICVNQHIVDKLEELRELHKAKSSEEDRWRAFSYGKCIPALRNYPKSIKSFSEARSIRGVGEKTALKIMEIVNTGDLRRIRYENTEDVAATRLFQGIYGVGRHTAFTWFASGLRTLDDVRAGKGGLKLSTAQEIGLKFYDDINSRMSREEAREIFDLIKPIALAIDDKLFIEIMGSYRRGKIDCGDIDILITRPTTDGKTHQGVLRILLERLHTAGIVTEDLAVPDDFSDLELIYRGLCKLPAFGAKRRRIDFLCVPWTSRGAALLYYTGDDIFNRAMRLKANRHGYSLNQRGLYAGVLRDPHDRQKKTCEGSIVASETEQEIFDILGVPWQEPHERVRG